MRQVKLGEWILHVVAILLGLFLLNYPAFDLTFGVFNSGDQSFLWPSIIGTTFNLVLFYSVSFYFIPVILKEKSTALFIIWLLAFLIVLSGLEFLIDYNFYIGLGKEFSGDAQSEIITMIVMVHVLTIIFGFAYRFSKDWFTNEKIRRSISEQQLRSELEVLKSQINPHFLFNALNNLFSMALHSGDDRTAEGISKLAEMMRYVFDRSGEEKVSLKEEIQYIEDYTHLQQIRFGKQVEVRFQHEECANPFTIAPMLLIPFVENAFKYGVSSQEKTVIEIRMEVENQTFKFSMANKVVEQKEAIPSSGVGIANAQKRLSLIYPNKHQLDINREDDLYKVYLSISN